jgi:hypothetical protein
MPMIEPYWWRVSRRALADARHAVSLETGERLSRVIPCAPRCSVHPALAGERGRWSVSTRPVYSASGMITTVLRLHSRRTGPSA